MDITRNGTGARSRRLLGWIVGVTLVAALVWTTPAVSGRASAAPGQRPNIVLILTDDQRWDTLNWMPNVRRLLVEKGVTFTNAFAGNSLCCPSRTAILTGQHSHTTGVWSNEWPTGGFYAFGHHDRSTIATWLNSVGYHTALIGKYLNEYGDSARAGYVPPGWDKWVSFMNNNGAHFDYDLTVNGAPEHHPGFDLSDYSTDVFANKAVNFIRNTPGPFFLYFAPFAPHEPYDHLPARDDCPAMDPYRSESFGEADVSDKPAYVRDATWTKVDRSRVGWIRRGQCNLVKGVDLAVGRIVAALQATNRLSNTMLVFMSDNGYMWGEHRLYYKAKPYEEAIRVPMVIRFDPVTNGARSESRIALNLDLAQTFANLAGAPHPGTEGRDLMPLISGAQAPWRNDFLLEHGVGSEHGYVAPDYCGLRSADWMYAMYRFGAEELYDLRSDPNEMTNIADDPAEQAKRRQMHAEVLRRCVPLPPGFPGH